MLFNRCSSKLVEFNFKIIAMCLALAFLFPGLAWAFDSANYQPIPMSDDFLKQFTTPYGRIIDHYFADDSSRLIIQIQDVHNDYGAQKNIQRLITHITGAENISVLAVEGSAKHLEIKNLRDAPYPEIKNRLYDYFMRAGYLSGAETAALTLPEAGVRLLGIEDPGQYAESLRLARALLRPETHRQLSQIRFLYEDLKDKLATAALNRLDTKREAFLDGRLGIKDYIAYLLQEAQIKAVAQTVRDGLREIDAGQNLEPAEWDIKLRGLVQNLQAGVWQHDERLLRFAALRQELEMLERMFSLAAFPEDIEYLQTRKPALVIRQFIDFYTEQAPGLDLPLEFVPDSARIQESLNQAQRFYVLAQARNRSLVNNLGRQMETLKTNRAILLVGGFHTPGIQQELRQGGWSYVTLRPALDQAASGSTYIGRLTGKPGPFRLLAGRLNQNLLAASSVFERGPEHQDFWQAFAGLYLAQAAPLLAGAGFRKQMARIAERINQGLPYPVAVDFKRLAALGPTGQNLLPLLLQAGGRTHCISAVRGRLRGNPAQPMAVLQDKQGPQVALYALEATPALAQQAVGHGLLRQGLVKTFGQVAAYLKARQAGFRARAAGWRQLRPAPRRLAGTLAAFTVLGWFGSNFIPVDDQPDRLYFTGPLFTPQHKQELSSAWQAVQEALGPSQQMDQAEAAMKDFIALTEQGSRELEQDRFLNLHEELINGHLQVLHLVAVAAAAKHIQIPAEVHKAFLDSLDRILYAFAAAAKNWPAHVEQVLPPDIKSLNLSEVSRRFQTCAPPEQMLSALRWAITVPKDPKDLNLLAGHLINLPFAAGFDFHAYGKEWWQTLEMMLPLIPPTEWSRGILRPVRIRAKWNPDAEGPVSTFPGRLARVHEFISTHEPIRTRLRQPDACVADIGLGGPEPYNAAALAVMLHRLNPQARLIGTDILLPAYVVQARDGTFAYFNERAELINIYSSYGHRMQMNPDQEFEKYFIALDVFKRCGQSVPGYEVLHQPHASMGQEAVFEIKQTRLADGLEVEPQVILAAHLPVLEEEDEGKAAIQSLTRRLPENGFLLTCHPFKTVLEDHDGSMHDAKFNLYQKQNGRLVPQAVYWVHKNRRYRIDLQRPAARGLTLKDAEDLGRRAVSVVKQLQAHAGEKGLARNQVFFLPDRSLVLSAQDLSIENLPAVELPDLPFVLPAHLTFVTRQCRQCQTLLGNLKGGSEQLQAWLAEFTAHARARDADKVVSDYYKLLGLAAKWDRVYALRAKEQQELWSQRIGSLRYTAEAVCGLVETWAREKADGTAWPRIPLGSLDLGEVISDARPLKAMAAKWQGQEVEIHYDKAFDDQQGRYYKNLDREARQNIRKKLLRQAGYYQTLGGLQYENRRVAPAVMGLVTDSDHEAVGYFLEPVPGTDLFTLMDERGLDEQELKEVLRQVKAQLSVLHDHGLGHNHLQAGNIRVEIKNRDRRLPAAERISARLVNFMPPDSGVKFNPIYELSEFAELKEELENWRGRPERLRKVQAGREFQRQYGWLLFHQSLPGRILVNTFHKLEPSLLGGELAPVRHRVCDLMAEAVNMQRAETYAAYEIRQADFQKACSRLSTALAQMGPERKQEMAGFLETLASLQEHSQRLIDCQALNAKIRALPAETWLGPEICQAFRGAQEKMPVLELSRAQDLEKGLDQLGPDFPGTQNIIVRLVENEVHDRFVLAIDTPDNFRRRLSSEKIEPIRAFYLTKVLHEILFFRKPGQSWEAKLDFIYIEPQQQGRKLGGAGVKNVCEALSKTLPGAGITCAAEHPATARMLVENYRAGINWELLRRDSSLRYPVLKGMRVLGIITDEQARFGDMDKIREFLQQAKAGDGMSQQADVVYLLDKTRRMAQSMMDKPGDYAGLAKKHHFRDARTPLEWEKQLPDLNEWTRFLFRQLFFSLPLTGKVPGRVKAGQTSSWRPARSGASGWLHHLLVPGIVLLAAMGVSMGRRDRGPDEQTYTWLTSLYDVERKLQAISIEQWLGPGLARVIAKDPAGRNGFIPVLDMNDLEEWMPKMESARQAGIRENQMVVVRLIQHHPGSAEVHFMLAIDTLANMRKAAISEPFAACDRCAVLLQLKIKQGSEGTIEAEIAAVSLAPGLRNQKLGGEFLQNTANCLRRILPRTPLTAVCLHPATLLALERHFGAQIAWEESLDHMHMDWSKTLAALGVIPAAAVPLQTDREALLQQLQAAKTAAGHQSSGTAEYLIRHLRSLAGEFRQEPSQYAALAREYGLAASAFPGSGQGKIPNEEEAALFLYQQLFSGVVMQGTIPERMSLLNWPDMVGDMRLRPLRIVAGFVLSSLGLLYAVSQGDLPLLWLGSGWLGLWALTYLPRLAYLALLSRSHAPPVTPESIQPLLEQLEALGGLPANYRRPAVSVLEQPSGPAWRQGVLLGRGEMTAAGPQVRLHPKFLALPYSTQLAILRHEIHEAHGLGHWRATWVEYAFLSRQAAAQGLLRLLRALPQRRLRPGILALLLLLPLPTALSPGAMQPRAWDDAEISAWARQAGGEIEQVWDITEVPQNIADKPSQRKMALALIEQNGLGAVFVASHFTRLFHLDADAPQDRGYLNKIALACARKDAAMLPHLGNFKLDGRRPEDRNVLADIAQAAAAQDPEMVMEHFGDFLLNPALPADRERIRSIALACVEKDPAAFLRKFKNTGLRGYQADHQALIEELALACIRRAPEATAQNFHQFQLQGEQNGRPVLRQRLLMHILAQAVPYRLNTLVNDTKGQYDVRPGEVAAYVQGLLDFAAGQGADVGRLKSSCAFDRWFLPWLESADLRQENQGQASRFFKILCGLDSLRAAAGSRPRLPQLTYLEQFTQPSSEASDQLTWYERFFFEVLEDLPAELLPSFYPCPQLNVLQILPLRWASGRTEVEWRNFQARLQAKKLSAPAILRLSEVCARLQELGVSRKSMRDLVSQALELTPAWVLSERLNSILFVGQGENGAETLRALAAAGPSAAWPKLDVHLLTPEEVRAGYSEKKLENAIVALNRRLGWEGQNEEILKRLRDPSGLSHLALDSDGNCVGYFIAIPGSKQEATLYFFAIHPQYQGVGLSQILFFAGMKEARAQGFQEMILEYDYRNAGARSFYLQQGLHWPILKHEEAGAYAQTGHPCMRLSYRLPPASGRDGKIEEEDMDWLLATLGIEEGLKADPENMLPFLYEHSDQAAAVSLQDVQLLLLSRDPERIKLGLEAVAMQYAQMPFEALELFTLTIMQLLGACGIEIQHMGLQVLQRVQPRFRSSAMRLLLAEYLGREDVRLRLEPWMVTAPQRLAGLGSFLVSFAPLRSLLSNPQGVIVQDVGCGGSPYPYTAAELTQVLHALNPKIRVEATDIVDPASMLLHPKTGQYTYFGAEGRPLNTYVEGAPAASSWVKPKFIFDHGRPPLDQGHMQSIHQDYEQGRALPAGFTVVEHPMQTYARNHGFTFRETAFGRGTRAQIKICFNMIYMYPGREAALVREIGLDLDEGGYLLIGRTVDEDETRSVFTLYQKQDGELKPESVYVLTQNLQVRLPLRGEHRTIRAAEELTSSVFHSEDLIPEPDILKAGGLQPKDVEVTEWQQQPEVDLKAVVSLEGKAGETAGSLRISWLPMAGSLLLGLGWYALFPDSALGAFPALALLLAWGANYLPRLAYLAFLSEAQARPLTPENIGPLLAQLEARGGLPENYARPAVSVLQAPAGWRGRLSVILGQGEISQTGPQVRLHPHFLALPRSLQLAVLRHEIYEAHLGGRFKHWRATWQEYSVLAQVLNARASRAWEGWRAKYATLLQKHPALAVAVKGITWGMPFMAAPELSVRGRQSWTQPEIKARPSAAVDEAAGWLRGLPVELWLTPPLLHALRSRPRQAAGLEPLKLEISSRAQLAEKTAELRQAGVPGHQCVIVRLIEKHGKQKSIRLIILADTLDEMQKIADHPAYLYQDHMLNQAEATLSLKFDINPTSGRVQKVKAEGISLAPELQNQGLGGYFLTGVREALRTVAPGALISAWVQHPAAAKDMALQYQAELVHEDGRVTVLRSQKALDGPQPATDLMYLLGYLKQMSERFSADPEAYTAWAEKHRLPERVLPRELREAAEVNEINLFLFEQFVDRAEVVGRIPDSELQDSRSSRGEPGGPKASRTASFHSVVDRIGAQLAKAGAEAAGIRARSFTPGMQLLRSPLILLLLELLVAGGTNITPGEDPKAGDSAQKRTPRPPLAKRMQSLPLETWLGARLLEKLRGSQSRLLVLDAERLEDMPALLQQARADKNISDHELLVVRVAEAGERDSVRFTLLADTLPRLESLSRNFSRHNKTINLNAARLVWVFRLEPGAGKNGKVEIRNLSLNPSWQDQDWGSEIAGNLKHWLQAHFPDAEVSAVVKHPAMVRIMHEHFQGEIDWSQIRSEAAPRLWAAALRMLDLAHPGEYIDEDMTSIREMLARARVQNGRTAGISDARFLMEVLERKAAWLQQHPETFDAQAQACGLLKSNSTFYLQDPGTTVRSWSHFLYQRLFGLLYIRGQVRAAEASATDQPLENSGPPAGAGSAGQSKARGTAGLFRGVEIQTGLRPFSTPGLWLAVWQWAESLAGHWQIRRKNRLRRPHPGGPRRSFLSAA